MQAHIVDNLLKTLKFFVDEKKSRDRETIYKKLVEYHQNLYEIEKVEARQLIQFIKQNEGDFHSMFKEIDEINRLSEIAQKPKLEPAEKDFGD